MYINSIRIEGFRNFKDNQVDFNERVNVIIGHNNAGKTNLLKALSLVLDNKSSRKLEIDDFNKNIPLADLRVQPPKVTVTLSIMESSGEDLTGDDLVTVSPWLTKLDSPYQAKLTYVFFLPEAEHYTYLTALAGETDLKHAWLKIKHDFLRKYVYKIYGGNPALQSLADSENLQKFDYQFLHAIRDVERDMLTGRSSLLREVIDFFMDFQIKNDTTKDKATKHSEILLHKQTFSADALALITQLQNRMKEGRDHIMKYADETGAAFDGAKPGFDGQISEIEMYSALKLIITHTTGIEIPATHNGLGYNNLIYMSLLLAKMQVDTNGEYLGSNAKVFPVLVIEEPEAHLHPSLQYKLLKFLHSHETQNARQIFITSHSTNITAAVSLDQIICLSGNNSGTVNIGYPGKVFSNDAAGKNSKAYVQRFLDATRSDMLFAKNIIMVEGIAEQLIIPTLGRYAGKNIEDTHTVVINIGGRYFDHFLKLFDSNTPHTIHKRVACITDQDPTRKRIGADNKHKKCYPFELHQDSATYEYLTAGNAQVTQYASHPNIRFFSQDPNLGKTLEYELMLKNPGSELLITDSVSNQAELKELKKHYEKGDTVNAVIAANTMHKSDENTRITDSLLACNGGSWDDTTKMKALLAARYLNSVSKGGNALEIAAKLEENLTATTPEPFAVPSYLNDAISWACQ
ncbi:ATP-dependent endonuclease [Pedobacter sp. SYSU D00535]|uniref:ATP-dependent nuclease n=1 Tax=Pedobacter sp. SYSU D00535 TaxID=2810308 RepID=UPI001A96F737|nr:AAA family ATPase [Pedobacter sp. SYSU D00535]